MIKVYRILVKRNSAAAKNASNLKDEAELGGGGGGRKAGFRKTSIENFIPALQWLPLLTVQIK